MMGESPKQQLKQRLSADLYWIRGLAIILVVAGHVIGFTADYGMRELYQMDLPVLGWAADRVNSIHMPVFFAISGLSFYIFSNRKTSYRDFFTKKATRLLVPLIVWSPLYFFFQNFYKGNSFSIADIFKSIIFPYEIFWFLHALIWITLFTFVYFRLSRSLAFYGIISLSWGLLGWDTDNVILRNGYWNLFYAVGLLIGAILPTLWERYQNYDWRHSRFIPSAVLALLTILFGVILSLVDPQLLGFDVSRFLIGIPAFFGWLVILIVFSPQEGANSHTNAGSAFYQSISYVGKQSLIVYIFHGYFTRAFALLVKAMPAYPLPGLYFVLSTVVGTVGPMALYFLILKRSSKLRYLVGES